RARLDMDEAARGQVVALRRVAEIHRQCPREDDERLFLDWVFVPAPLGARLVAPEVRADVGKSGPFAQLGDVARRLPGLGWSRDPFELVGTDHAEGHERSLVIGLPSSPRRGPGLCAPSCPYASSRLR